ncbi:MAG: hypothetical protein ACFFCS_24880 [Candidatus Hodarchaeota archaeon]
MEIVNDFKDSWASNNRKHGIEEEFPDYVVDIAEQVKNFMLPENRKYQGAVGNARGMLDAVVKYAKLMTIENSAKFSKNINLIFDFLLKVRLTSQVPLNTSYFINQKMKKLDPASSSIDELKKALINECEFHKNNYKEVREKIARNMSNRIIDRCQEYDVPNITIGTHCHSGAVVKTIIQSKDYINQVVVSKTEPEQQGVLTAKELCDEGIDVKFITLAQYGIEFRRVNMFLFGIDAVSAEGMVLNKMGTRMIATLAHTKELPVYFLGSTYKYARNTLLGGLVRVERRNVIEHILHNHVGVDLNDYVKEGKLTTKFYAFDTTRPEFYNSTVSERGFLPMRDAFEMAWKDYL